MRLFLLLLSSTGTAYNIGDALQAALSQFIATSTPGSAGRVISMWQDTVGAARLCSQSGDHFVDLGDLLSELDYALSELDDCEDARMTLREIFELASL